MGKQDNALRQTAIPFTANVWGYNRSTDSDNSIANNTTATLGDLANFQTSVGTLQLINPVRFLQPRYGNLIEANLNIYLAIGVGDIPTFCRLAIGYFQSGSYSAQTSYTDSEINTSHQIITGRTTPYSIGGGLLSQQKLNLLPAMYKRGDARFNEDGFVLLIVFDHAPSTAPLFALDKLEVDCSMQLGQV